MQKFKNKTLNKEFIYKILFFIWLIFIFFLSSLEETRPAGIPDNLQFVLRKVFHIFEFFILNLFLLKGFSKNKKDNILFTLISILFAILDEIHQFFVLNRVASIFDVLIDTIGILFSYIIYNLSKLKHS
ncbi:VanZ family protein [Patescibacteria group bacterium]|nr:VanZ family protein [Patescibacteria group bacterium]